MLSVFSLFSACLDIVWLENIIDTKLKNFKAKFSCLTQVFLWYLPKESFHANFD